MAILTEQKTNQRAKPSWFMPHVDPWACPFFCVGHLLYVKYCIYKANFAEPNWTNEDQSWKNHYLFPGLKVGEGGRGKGIGPFERTDEVPITENHQAAMLKPVIDRVMGDMRSDHILHMFRLSSAQIALTEDVPVYDVETQGNWTHGENSNVLERHYLSKCFLHSPRLVVLRPHPSFPRCDSVEGLSMIYLRFVSGWPAGGGLFGAGRFDSGLEYDEEEGERPVDALVRSVMPGLAAAIKAEDKKYEDFKNMTKVQRDKAQSDGRAPNFNLLNSGKALLCCVEVVSSFSVFVFRALHCRCHFPNAPHQYLLPPTPQPTANHQFLRGCAQEWDSLKDNSGMFIDGPFHSAKWGAFRNSIKNSTVAYMTKMEEDAGNQLASVESALKTPMLQMYSMMKSMYSGSQACSHAAHSVGPAQQLSDASKLTASAKRTYDLALLHDKHSGVAKGAKGGGALVASAALPFLESLPEDPPEDGEEATAVLREAATFNFRGAVGDCEDMGALCGVLSTAVRYEAAYGDEKRFGKGGSWRGAKLRKKAGDAYPSSAGQCWRDMTPIRQFLEAHGGCDNGSARSALVARFGCASGRTFKEKLRELTAKLRAERVGGKNKVMAAIGKAGGESNKKQRTGD